MAELRLPGLATGIDTMALVKQLMEVNSRRLYMMQDDLKKHQEKYDAVSELESKLNALKSAVKSLSDGSQLRSYNAVTSDSDYMTAEANSNAFEGNHSVQIKQLATGERWVHDGFEYKTSYVGAGNFIFSYNHQELVVTTTAETTLEDLVGLINNDADNPGVNASILKYDDGSDGIYHLVLSGKESGSDYQITINASNTEVWTADSTLTDVNGNDATLTTKLNELSTFDEEHEFGEGDTPDRIHITGADHDGVAVDAYFEVTPYTTVEDLIKEINDAFNDTATATFADGEIKLTDHTCGDSDMTITLDFVPGLNSEASLTLPTFSQTTDGGTVSASIANLAAATFTETQSAQDSEIRVDGYPAASWITRSSNTVDDVIAGVTLKLHDTTEDGVGGYNSIEVNLTRDTETLKTKINSMIEAYNTVVMFIQEKTAYDEQTNTSEILANEYSVTTIWNLIKTSFDTAASGFTGDDSFIQASDIGIDLGTDRLLTLDSTDFDEAIVDDYLGVLALIGAVKTGSSDSQDIKFYNASTYTTAGEFEVRVYGDGSQITSAQIREVGDTEWREATFSDDVVTGNSEFDDNGNPVYPENGLQVTVDVSKTSGTALEATISVKQGFAGALWDSLDEMLDTVTGRVPISKDRIEDTIDNTNDRIEEEKERLARQELRLIEKFARMEKYLSMIQQQMAGLQML
jgi:flagellar hook-associated protein 2